MKDNAIVINNFNSNTVFVKHNDASTSIQASNDKVSRDLFSRYLTSGSKEVSVFSKDKYGNTLWAPTAVCLVSDKVDTSTYVYDKSFPIVYNKKPLIRYIRSSASGSSASSGSHWSEIQATKDGVNLALNKKYAIDDAAYANGPTTDGVFNTTYSSATRSVTVDLEEACDIDFIIVSHYPDGRTYKKTKLEVSEDNDYWITLFDSDIEGTYAEKAGGRSFDINEILFNKSTDPTMLVAAADEKQRYEVAQEDFYLINTSESIVSDIRNKHDVLIRPLKEEKVFSLFNHTTVESDVLSTVVRDKQEVDFSIGNNFKQASMIVSTKIPVDSGSGSVGGEGLKAFNLELQPLSYINMKLDFTSMEIIEIVGLPPGLILDKGYIKGSPVISGDYNTKFLLSNNTFIPGKIKVHVLDRKL